MPSSATPFENKIVQFEKSIADIAVPEKLSATSLKFRYAAFFGYYTVSGVRTVNTGSIWIGPNSGNGTQMLEVPPGGQAVHEAIYGESLDFTDLYADADVAAEKVTVNYIA